MPNAFNSAARSGQIASWRDRYSSTGATLGARLFTVIGDALPVPEVAPFRQGALTGLVILVAVTSGARGTGRRSGEIVSLHRTKVPSAHAY